MRGPRRYIQTTVGPDGLPRSEIKLYQAKSGAQRMRELRRRNPGYDRIYKAKVRAERQARLAAREAKKAALTAQMLAPQQTVLMLPAPAARLCLPAPVVDPWMAAIDALAMKPVQQSVAA